jgi:hypothetical protein
LLNTSNPRASCTPYDKHGKVKTLDQSGQHTLHDN